MPSSILILVLLATAKLGINSLPLPRRALHHPFFPLLSIPSPNDDFTPPSSPPPPPTSFFPVFTSPPPPPALPKFPTVPANLSAVGAAPVPPRRASRFTPRRLAPLIALPAAALAVLMFTLGFVVFSRRRRSGAGSDDSRRFFEPNSIASDGRKLSSAVSPPAAASSAAASDFLYLGTLVSSRPAADAAAAEPYQKLSSPELRPLPPLSRHHHNRNGSSDEEFYSPNGNGSPIEKQNPNLFNRNPNFAPSSSHHAAGESVGNRSPDSSRNVIQESLSPISTLSSPSRVSNASSSSISSRSVTVRELGSNVFIPPPPLAPPRMLRPMTPSPPKRNPFSGNVVTNGPPPPPPRPPVVLPPRSVGRRDGDEDVNGKPRLKLKPLHWDKVNASCDGTMVWDRLRSSSFELNEEMIAELFVYDKTNGAMKDPKRQFNSSPNQESTVLDFKKAQNIAIQLRALNVTKEEVCSALSEGNTDSLGNELLETLLKMAPSKEEEFQLKEYNDDSPFKLGPAEKFLKAVLDIPFAFKRVDAMLYIANFEPDISYLWNSFGTFEAACVELRSSRLFLKLLEAVLKTGNRMNIGTNRGDAEAFKLDTLLKLVDVKGADGKTTLLHFVVQEITKAEGLKTDSGFLVDDLECRKLGLQAVSGLGSELNSVKKAASLDSDVLSSYVAKLTSGMAKIREVQRLSSGLAPKEKNQQFHDTMCTFLTKAEGELTKLQDKERTSMNRVKEVTIYFQGDSAKEEGQPLRTFIVVRDFLGILDKVCKDVERINERAAASTIHHVSVPAIPSQLPVFPNLHTLRSESSDDESSSSSMT